MDGDKNAALEREIIKSMGETRLKKGADFHREFITLTFEKAMAFNALVMSVGYVGLFALWDRARPDLSPPERAVTLSLITISLTTYLGWQIKGQMTFAKLMLLFTQQLQGMDMGDAERINEVSAKLREEGARTRAMSLRWLPLVMGIAVGLAALAALVLVIELVSHIGP